MDSALVKSAASPRLMSIDALRGFDMMWIVGGDRLVHALAKWWGGPRASELSRQFRHVEWEGFRFYDLIFPLFLFLVGVVLPFSVGKLLAQGRSAAYRRVVRRVLLLFALGLLCNGILRFDWENLRITGVLQRIAICYGIAAIIDLHTTIRGKISTILAILLGYWALLAMVPAPGGSAGDFSKEGNLAGWVDRAYLPGKILEPFYGFGDNEGLLSTIPAIATTLLGVLAGHWLRSQRGNWTKAAGLAAAGSASLMLGLIWGQTFPIVKNLWTSSFVLVAGGWSLLLLAAFYTVIDVLGWRKWAFFFVVIGVNAITIYVVPRFVDFNYTADFFLSGIYQIAETHGSVSLRAVIAAAGALLAKWLFLLILYRKKMFLRV